MRPYENKRQLRPWARKTKEAFLLTGLGVVSIAASYGAYLFLTELQGIASQQGPNPLGFGSLGLMGVLVFIMWGFWLSATRQRLLPLLLGVDVSALITVNMLYAGMVSKVATIVGILLFWAILLFHQDVANLIWEPERR